MSEETGDCSSEVNSEIPKWNDTDDVKLLYSVFDCKPVGINKHLHLMEIVNNLNDFNKAEGLSCVTPDVVWQRLNELYNLNLLDKFEPHPRTFPIEEIDFDDIIEQLDTTMLPKPSSGNKEEQDDEDKPLAKKLIRSESEESKVSGIDNEENNSIKQGKSSRKKSLSKTEDNVSSEEEPATKTLRSRGRNSNVKASASPATSKKKKL